MNEKTRTIKLKLNIRIMSLVGKTDFPKRRTPKRLEGVICVVYDSIPSFFLKEIVSLLP